MLTSQRLLCPNMNSSSSALPRLLSRRSLVLQSTQCLRTRPYVQQRYIQLKGSNRIGRPHNPKDFLQIDPSKHHNPLDNVTIRAQNRYAGRKDHNTLVKLFGALTVTLGGLWYTASWIEIPPEEGSPADLERKRIAREEAARGKGRGSGSNLREWLAGESSFGSAMRTPMAADAPKDTPDTFQGRPIVVAPGGEKLVAHDQRTGEDIELVPTGTSSVPHFPKTIFLPTQAASEASRTLPAGGNLDIAGHTGEEEYTLVGLGIRTVSFLSIQVYVVGLYVSTASLATLQQKLIKRVNPTASALIPGEKEQLRQALLDAEESSKIWEALLRDTRLGATDRDGVNMALRVVPTRGTDFNHLRDGWVRGITARVQDAQKQGNNEYSDESFGAVKREFEKLLSGKGKAAKGSIVLLTRATDGKLGVLFQAKEKGGEVVEYGSVADERLSRLIWLVYFGGKNVSSEPARKGVADGCVGLVERPVGTVETMVG